MVDNTPELDEPWAKLATVVGSSEQRGGEDRRNDARGVEFQRQERALPLVHLVADLPAGIGDRHPPLRPLHEHDEGDDDERP